MTFHGALPSAFSSEALAEALRRCLDRRERPSAQRRPGRGRLRPVLAVWWKKVGAQTPAPPSVRAPIDRSPGAARNLRAAFRELEAPPSPSPRALLATSRSPSRPARAVSSRGARRCAGRLPSRAPPHGSSRPPAARPGAARARRGGRGPVRARASARTASTPSTVSPTTRASPPSSKRELADVKSPAHRRHVPPPPPLRLRQAADPRRVQPGPTCVRRHGLPGDARLRPQRRPPPAPHGR
jgi:hypothetical protein